MSLGPLPSRKLSLNTNALRTMTAAHELVGIPQSQIISCYGAADYNPGSVSEFGALPEASNISISRHSPLLKWWCDFIYQWNLIRMYPYLMFLKSIHPQKLKEVGRSWQIFWPQFNLLFNLCSLVNDFISTYPSSLKIIDLLKNLSDSSHSAKM